MLAENQAELHADRLVRTPFGDAQGNARQSALRMHQPTTVGRRNGTPKLAERGGRSNGPAASSGEDLPPRKDYLLVGGEGVAVGHAGDEVYGLDYWVGIAPGPLLPVPQEVAEEYLDDPGGLLVLPRATAATVDVLEEPTPQPHQRRVPLVGECYLTLLFRCRDHVPDEGVYPTAHLFAEGGDRAVRQVLEADDSRPQRVVYVVVDVRDAVGDAHDLTLPRRWVTLPCMVTYAVSNL